MCPSVHNSIIYNSQDMEANSMSTNRWTDKENVVYMYDGIPLLSYKKNEILPFETTWMDFEGIIPSAKVRKRKTKTVWYHLYV